MAAADNWVPRCWRQVRAALPEYAEVLGTTPDERHVVVQALVGSRVQRGLVSLVDMPTEPWLQVTSEVGPVARLPLRAVLVYAGKRPGGGLIVDGEFVYYRLSAPLSQATDELVKEYVITAISSADLYEEVFTGRDDLR